MKILIEITNDIYEHAKETTEDSNDEFNAMRAISNGKPINNDPVLNCWIGKEVLLKISAEIDLYLYQHEFGTEYRKEILQIIDKYIYESEGNNGQ